jgi:PEP-CTERM motif
MSTVRKLRGLVTFVPCLVLIGALQAQADSISVSGTGPGENVSISYTPVTGPGTVTQSPFAGQLNATLISGSTSTPFNAYCIDIYHDFSPPALWTLATDNTSFTPDSSNPAFGTAGNNPGTGNTNLNQTQHALAYLYNTYSGLNVGSNSANVQAAALQLALWAVEYDGLALAANAGLGTGTDFNFTTDATTLAQFQTDIANVQAANIANQTADFFMADHSHYPNAQDFIGGNGPNFTPFASVPEPSSLLLVTAGLGSVALAVRKARRSRIEG